MIRPAKYPGDPGDADINPWLDILEQLAQGAAAPREAVRRVRQELENCRRREAAQRQRAPAGVPLLSGAADMRDNTARQRPEEQFQPFLGVLEAVANAVVITEIDGTIRWVNPAFTRLTGYSAAEALGQNPRILKSGLQDTAFYRDLWQTVTAGRVWHGELINRHKDGHPYTEEMTITPMTNTAGVVTHYVAIKQDVTARKQAEEELLKSRTLLAEAAKLAHTGAWEWDILADRWSFSDEWRAIHGCKKQPLTLAELLLIVHPEDRSAVQQAFDDAQKGVRPYSLEHRILRQDNGAVRVVKAYGVVLRDPTGTPAKMVGVAHDITASRQAEADQRAKQVAEAANKAKDQFIAVLSHELRTPLTPVLTMVQMLERDAALSVDQRESLQMVERNVVLETRLIDDLLDLTRISRGKLELHLGPVDLHALLPHVLRICESDWRGKQLRLALELRAAHHHVYGDAARLQQIFWNLLKNAIKFTPQGGSITVRSTQPQNDRLALTVQDTGQGIEPDMLPRIFNPFEQGNKGVTRLFGGLGLGLSIARNLVELHGGTLTAFSAGTGQGAAFTVDLPVALDAETAAPRVGSGSGATGHLRSGRILLVEDSVDTAMVMSKLLRSHGYEVRTADSVAAALRAAAAESFDLMLCDIGLPDGNGLDLMRQMARQWPLKGIALSGYGMEEDIQRSKAAGFLTHLTKPVDLGTLEAALDHALTAVP